MKKGSKIVLIILASVFAIFIAVVTRFAVSLHYEPDVHTSGKAAEGSLSEYENDEASDEAVPVVYMTNEISPEALMKIYETLGVKPEGKVAVKLSTGEAGGHNYLSPDLIKDLVEEVDGTIVECNTGYDGSRSSTEMHLQTAKDHGFTEIADLDIMDADGEMPIPVSGGRHLTENYVGSHLADYDFVLVLSHFKGHAMAGFGGALKNISIGIASRPGKIRIHTAGKYSENFMRSYLTNQNDFLESMAEAAKSVSDYEGGGERMLYINVMNRLSISCDCESNPKEPTMADIGILASADPVALDQACVDLVYEAADGQDLQKRMEEKNGIHILSYAEQIGLGSTKYKLVNIDE